jgi:protease I
MIKEILEGKKALFIVAPEGFQDKELLEPMKELIEHKIEIKIASKKVKEAKGKLGGIAIVDYDLDDVLVQDYDTIIFVGGPGAETYFDDETAHSIAREAIEEERIVAAICIAPVILANAGILKGKRATVFPSGKKDIEKQGAKYTGEDVTVDGNIVTANGPLAAKKFANKIIELLSK